MEHAAGFRLIVGLGNPGRQYADTRHNAGYFLLDELARRTKTAFHFEAKWNAEIAFHEGRCLMKPRTFMNLSGEAAGGYARYHKLAPAEVLVVLDDVALPLGDLRIRRGGSAGGHHGLESVLAHLGTNAVPRLRVGIGAASGNLSHHVLGTFTADEVPVLQTAVARAADAVETAEAAGIESAMNLYNQKQTL